uniref:Uncharacterized protein n=1 Tax=viral metagenome TaxID=1070528 RepID=A0A6M3X719_9ZZZZ
MAYCTPEDTEYLLSQGFTVGSDGSSFGRVVEPWYQSIQPVWERMKPGMVDVPPADGVFWGAYSVSKDRHNSLELVVQLSDRQPTPISCFVTAEVRGWRREK